MDENLSWDLVNPEGVVDVPPFKLNGHAKSLEGKTVLLFWNGKHNGNLFLDRIGELLTEKVKDVKLVKSWKVEKETAQISQNPGTSAEFARKLVKYKPDLSIGSQGD